MKKNFIAILLLVVTSAVSAQINLNSKDFYLQKSKHQKTAAWIMVGGGAILVVTGNIIYANGMKGDKLGDYLNILNPKGPALAVLGAVTMLGSIPLFIASVRNKHKAVSLTMTNQRTPILQENNIVYRPIPSLTLKLSL